MTGLHVRCVRLCECVWVIAEFIIYVGSLKQPRSGDGWSLNKIKMSQLKNFLSSKTPTKKKTAPDANKDGIKLN